MVWTNCRNYDHLGECSLDFLQSPLLLISGSGKLAPYSVKDFYPLQRAKFTGGIFLLCVLSNHEQFYWCAVNQTQSRSMKRD